MYFLSEEERKKILYYYLPQIRTEGVAEELRGWNWHQPPLVPVYDCLLAVYEAANAYCCTSRDLYLRRVAGVGNQRNNAMIQGTIFHAMVAGCLVATKRLIYSYGVKDCQKLIQTLRTLKLETVLGSDELTLCECLDESIREETTRKLQLLWNFERDRVVARLQEVLVKHPYIGDDALAMGTVPVVVEQKLDGSFLGLSSNLSVDAVNMGETMIVDLKFGEPKKFHRLTTTGYALVMEAVHEHPVNVGCLVYVSFKGERVIIKRDLHLIDDELRQWFVENRDEKARMIFEEIEPGVAQTCSKDCPYSTYC